jgi:uncharacterized protein YjeT (DUF2065 family)
VTGSFPRSSRAGARREAGQGLVVPPTLRGDASARGGWALPVRAADKRLSAAILSHPPRTLRCVGPHPRLAARGAVVYRNIQLPADPGSLTDSSQWCDFAAAQGLLRAVSPLAQAGTCKRCLGAVGAGWTECPQCRNYYHAPDGWWPRFVLDGVVPVTYSPDDGFESLLHRYKDLEKNATRRANMGVMIASVLIEFLTSHLGCIVERYGPIDLAVSMPHAGERADRPFQTAINTFDATVWPVEWDHDFIENIAHQRPGRGELRAEYYRPGKNRSVEGRRLLVVDDTWTSGSTLASAAAMLRSNGAGTVVGLPIGRQVKDGSFGTAHELYTEVHTRGFDRARCILCA